VAYFIDGVNDLLKQMFSNMGLKDLSKRALDKKLPIEVRIKVVDLMANYGPECLPYLEKVVRKADGEVSQYAQKKIAETRDRMKRE
jgi:hypothetical protein